MPTELIDPRTVAGRSAWYKASGALHLYQYPGGGNASLQSIRMSALRDFVEPFTNGTAVQEIYFVREMIPRVGPVKSHGEHWHQHKIEAMFVVAGAWSFELRSPIDPEHRDKFTIEEGHNTIVVIYPGTRHVVTPDGNRGTRCILGILSTTEYDEKNNDTYTNWPF